MTNHHAKKKRFDCVDMMHQGAVLVHKELACKSLEEQAIYWRKNTEVLLKRQAKLRKKELQS